MGRNNSDAGVRTVHRQESTAFGATANHIACSGICKTVSKHVVDLSSSCHVNARADQDDTAAHQSDTAYGVHSRRHRTQ